MSSFQGIQKSIFEVKVKPTTCVSQLLTVTTSESSRSEQNWSGSSSRKHRSENFPLMPLQFIVAQLSLHISIKNFHPVFGSAGTETCCGCLKDPWRQVMLSSKTRGLSQAFWVASAWKCYTVTYLWISFWRVAVEPYITWKQMHKFTCVFNNRPALLHEMPTLISVNPMCAIRPQRQQRARCKQELTHHWSESDRQQWAAVKASYAAIPMPRSSMSTAGAMCDSGRDDLAAEADDQKLQGDQHGANTSWAHSSNGPQRLFRVHTGPGLDHTRPLYSHYDDNGIVSQEAHLRLGQTGLRRPAWPDCRRPCSFHWTRSAFSLHFALEISFCNKSGMLSMIHDSYYPHGEGVSTFQLEWW